MKKVLFNVGIMTSIALFGITGCASDKPDDGNSSLIGKWSEACRLHEVDGIYQVDTITFKSDKTFTYHRDSYSDANCQNSSNDTNDATGTYKEDGSFTDSHDHNTTGLVLTITGEGSMYTMYRFKNNGNLLIADSTEAKDGSTSDLRKNSISLEREGYVKQN